MMLALALLFAQAVAPPQEPQGELPAAAAIHARKKAEAAHPNRVEGTMVTPGHDVRADDIVDEMLDEFSVDIARLGAAHISPVLLDRVRVSANMNPEYAHIFEARLALTTIHMEMDFIWRFTKHFAPREMVEQHKPHYVHFRKHE